MISSDKFKIWLISTGISERTAMDVVSRIKHLDKMLPFNTRPEYAKEIESNAAFSKLRVTNKSHHRRALRLYTAFLESESKTV